MNASTLQNPSTQPQLLRLSNLNQTSARKKNFVPNFYHRGATAFVILALLILSVIAANAA